MLNGSEGKLTIEGGENGSYLYHTRTELKVKDKKLVFIFNPSIAASPVDPIDPSPGSPLPNELDPQTTIISGAASSNLAFIAQGLDLIIDKVIDLLKSSLSNLVLGPLLLVSMPLNLNSSSVITLILMSMASLASLV